MKRCLLLVVIVLSGLTGCATLDALDGDGSHTAEYRREQCRPELEDPLFAQGVK